MTAAATTIAMPVSLQQGHESGISFLRRSGVVDRTPLVLLHGIGSNAASFTPLMRELGDLHPCLAWDAPGYGGSEPLATEWPSAGDYAEALDALLQRLGIRRAILLGHSLGALIAARFAATHADRIAGLILVSPAAGYACAPGAPLPDATRVRLEELQQLGPAAFAAKRSPRLVSDPGAMPEVLASVERAMAAINVAGYVQATRMLASGRIFDDLSQLSSPSLVICGARDVITPPDQAMRVAAAIPEAARTDNGEAVIVHGAGHALPQEQPKQLAAFVRDFAGGLGAARRSV